MDNLVAERVGDNERTAVDFRAGTRRSDGRNVANRATHLGKQSFPARTSAFVGPRDRAFVARMKSASATISTPSSSSFGNWIKPGSEADKTAARRVLRKQRIGHIVEVG